MAVEQPPGPTGVPIVGSPLTFLRDPFRAFETWVAEYGDVVAVTIFGNDFYVVAHPEYVEEVLVEKHAAFEKGRFQNEQLGAIIGEGLLLSEGAYWREQRQRVQPSFAPAAIDEYTAIMRQEASEAVAAWEDGQTLVLNEVFQRLSLQIMARSLFGVDLGEVGETFASTARTISERFDLGAVSTYLPPWVPTPQNRAYGTALDELDAAIYGLIEERRAADESSDDLLGALLRAEDDEGTSLSDETIRDEIATVLLGGHDTTALAMTYTIYLLATHERTSSRVRTELDDVLGGAPPSVTDVGELPVLENAIREAMRIYPPAYTLFREAVEPVEIGGFAVPEGTTLALPQWVVHRDDRWFDEPDAFRPDRWATESAADRPTYAYFPFAGGPRRCIGMEFGLREITVVLATVLQDVEFTVTMDEPLSFSPALTLQPEDGVTVQVERR